MKAITLVKSFTVVLIFLAGVVSEAGTCTGYLNKEDCVSKKSYSIAKQMKCDDKKGADGTSDYTQIRSCKDDAKEQAGNDSICEACDSKSEMNDAKASCDSKFAEYQTSLKATNAACAKAKGGSLSTCRDKAAACGMDASDVESGSDLSGMIGMLMSGSNPKNSSGGACALYDPTFEERKGQIDDQIQRLKDEQVDAVTKQSELDDELNNKKNEVNEKVSDLEAEFRKADTEKKTQSQQEAADLQKKILASDKVIRDNLIKVADKNVEIANLSFGIQQIMIESSNLAVNKNCTDKYNAAFNAAFGLVTGADGKKTKPKYTMRENSKIRADLRLIQTQCLQIEGVKRDAQLKGIADKRRSLTVEIDTYMKSNEDEQKSIALDRKALEDKEKLLTDDQKKALEEKNTKLDNLNKSVVDFAAVVDKKKKALDAKIEARNVQIKTLSDRKNNLQPIFDDVQSTISDSRDAGAAYKAACCTVKPYHTGCVQVKQGLDPGTGFGPVDPGVGN